MSIKLSKEILNRAATMPDLTFFPHYSVCKCKQMQKKYIPLATGDFLGHPVWILSNLNRSTFIFAVNVSSHTIRSLQIFKRVG